MEIVINFALRGNDGKSNAVCDIRIRDLVMKDRDDVVQEIYDQLDDVIEKVITEAGFGEGEE